MWETDRSVEKGGAERRDNIGRYLGGKGRGLRVRVSSRG